jgi:hypothetical protein
MSHSSMLTKRRKRALSLKQLRRTVNHTRRAAITGKAACSAA